MALIKVRLLLLSRGDRDRDIRSLRKTFVVLKLARDWEIYMSKGRERIYNSKFSKVDGLRKEK